MRTHRVVRHAVLLAAALGMSFPTFALAQEPIEQPAEFAALPQRFEDMTRADWATGKRPGTR